MFDHAIGPLWAADSQAFFRGEGLVLWVVALSGRIQGPRNGTAGALQVTSEGAQTSIQEEALEVGGVQREAGLYVHFRTSSIVHEQRCSS